MRIFHPCQYQNGFSDFLFFKEMLLIGFQLPWHFNISHFVKEFVRSANALCSFANDFSSVLTLTGGLGC